MRMCLFLIIGGPLFAQAVQERSDASRFTVPLKFDDGRLVTACEQADFKPTDRFNSLVARSLKQTNFVRGLCAAIDRAFRLMPKVFYDTLRDDQQAAEDIGTLAPDPAIDGARKYSGPLAGYPLRDSLGLAFPSVLAPKLQRNLPTMSPLKGPLEDSGSGSIDFIDPVTHAAIALNFVVRDPIPTFSPDHVVIADAAVPPLLTSMNVSKLLSPLNGLPANEESIRRILDDFYITRGYSPRIDINLDVQPKTITIGESRVSALLLPPEMKIEALEQILMIFWNAAPNQVFRGFRNLAKEKLAQETGDSPFRQVDFNAVSAVVSVPLHSGLLQDQQASLAAIGYKSTLVDLGDGFLGLAVMAAPKSDGGSAAETPPAASQATGNPDEAADLHPQTPHPLAGGNNPDTKKLIANEEDKRRFIGGGVEYKPGQSFRLFGTGHVRRLLGDDLLTVDAGGNGSGVATGTYSRDFIGLAPLGMRLAFTANGGTDYVQKRILDGLSTDERRTGGGARIDLEAFRERSGHTMTFSLEGRRTTVRLTPEGLAEAVVNLNTFETGVDYTWARRAAIRQFTLHLRPSLSFGDPQGAGQPNYRILRTEAEWRQNISKSLPVEFDVRFHLGIASGATPVFDLPSLGGVESMRGFRDDDALGRRYWSAQNEVWIPFTGMISGQTKVGAFVRRNVWLAPFADVGGVYQAHGTSPGLRYGLGAGPRMRYKGAIFGLDFGYGFGDGASSNGHGRIYFNIRLP